MPEESQGDPQAHLVSTIKNGARVVLNLQRAGVRQPLRIGTNRAPVVVSRCARSPQKLIFSIDRETITNQTGRAPTVHHSSHLRESRERRPIKGSVQRENLKAQGMKRQSGFSAALQRKTLFGNSCLSSSLFSALLKKTFKQCEAITNPTNQRMKKQNCITLITALCGSLLAIGCASTPNGASRAKYPTADSILKENYVKEKPPTVYQHPIEEVRPAAARALNFVGCKVETQEDFYITGKRPNKMGFFVGSGGETVKVFLYPQSTNQTQVWVDTDLSFVGIVGQKDWNKEVIDEMTHILNKP